MLDESFRSRVREIGSVAPSTLDESARERILARVGAEGPAHVRAGRRARLAYFAAGPVLAAAAAVAIFAVRHGGEQSSVVEGPVAASSRPSPVCSTRPVAVGARAGFVSGAGGDSLDLGALAFAVAEPGTAVHLASAAPCRTELELAAGRVTVHAKDLGGGELVVRSRGVDVTVHGTIFAVARAADVVTVEVAEGRVEVTDPSGSHWVSSGGRLQLSGVGAAEGPLGAERSRAIRSAVGAPEVVGLDTLVPVSPEEKAAAPGVRPAAPSRGVSAAPASAAEAVGATPVDLGAAERAPAVGEAPLPGRPVDSLALAEEARRAGDFAKARELYRRAGDGRGVTAEAAWVALGRMELSLGHAAAAREATKRRQERFGQGTLAPEALWIDVRTYRQTGDLGRARELAADLVARWPSSPQARAAQQWLSAE